jgi:hypothetical protein
VKASATVADASSRQVQVQLTMDVRELLLPVTDGRRETKLNVMILCGDSKRTVIGKFDREMTLSLDEKQYQQVLATGLPYAVTIPVSAKPEHIKVIVYQYDSDKLGSLSVRPQ